MYMYVYVYIYIDYNKSACLMCTHAHNGSLSKVKFEFKLPIKIRHTQILKSCLQYEPLQPGVSHHGNTNPSTHKTTFFEL